MRTALLDWYRRHQRALPWRRTRDPYAILVSEIMLQQTQVDRVVPKYLQFLERFPSFRALAEATRAEVIQLWAPLGYNRRAVRLHELARQVANGAGRLPADPEQLERLEGLGAYTAAAVACFAFDRQVPTIDTNVRRVLGRIFADRFGAEGPGRRELKALAAEALPPGRAYAWNQALMDLGATICTARAPACLLCPLAADCSSAGRLPAAPGGTLKRAAERRAAYDVGNGYAGSSRYYRGRIVDRLRKLEAGGLVAIDELGDAVRDDYSVRDRPWLLELVRGLERDGLARLEASSGGGVESEAALRVGLP